MGKSIKVEVSHDSYLLSLLGFTLFLFGMWCALGGYRDHCREYPNATICVAYYGAAGPHAPVVSAREEP